MSETPRFERFDPESGKKFEVAPRPLNEKPETPLAYGGGDLSKRMSIDAETNKKLISEVRAQIAKQNESTMQQETKRMEDDLSRGWLGSLKKKFFGK